MSVFVLVDDADEGIEYSPVSENAYKGEFNLSQIVDGWAAGAIGAYLSMKYMLYFRDIDNNWWNGDCLLGCSRSWNIF